MRAHSTGAGDGGALFVNGLPIGSGSGRELQHRGPQQQQQLHANSMQALARRASREARTGAGQLCAALSNESVRDVHDAQRRPSPTGSGGGDRLATPSFGLSSGGQHLRAAPGRHREAINGDGGASLHAQAVSVLRKSSFTCTVLGARQTGKRTIVICFVKLLNEFKLAADECKKEEMLTKLVECSERLQELASRAEDQEQQEAIERAQQQQQQQQQQQREAEEGGEDGGGRRQRRTSRLNSWLPSSGAVRQLLNLSPVSAKKRLHSVVSPLLTTGAKTNTDQHQELSQRRHTTFEPPSSQQQQQQQQQRAGIQSSSSSRMLSVQTSGDNNLLSSGCQNANKSDTNISYQATQFEREPSPAGGHQLQVPSLDAAMLRKHSDPTGFRGARQQQHHQQERLSTQSPGSVFLHEGAESQASPARLVSGQRRHTTLVGLPHDTCDQRRRHRHRNTGEPHGPPSASKSHARRQSICLSRRRRRIMLSLKELNRRKFSIKFSTRRQISESLVAQIRASHAERQQAAASARGRRRSTILQLTGGGGGGSAPGRNANSLVLPDSFLVIYSINDRDSFEYAKSLVGQLRSLASQQPQEIPLPIVLVANKSDLERNREVKAADGRAVAKRYACKFIEISCTIGFNLDNLLVGLRTQLVLKHHIVLNSILRPGFRYKARYMKAGQQQHDNGPTKRGDCSDEYENNKRRQAATKDKRGVTTNKTASDNILIRLCKRYVMDSNENDYDCDNFSKL